MVASATGKGMGMKTLRDFTEKEKAAAKEKCFSICSEGGFIDHENRCFTICKSANACGSWHPYAVRADLAPPLPVTALPGEVDWKARAEALEAALQDFLNAVCGPVGFASAVRHDSGLAYPWHSLDDAEAKARALVAAAKEPRHE
jgi:hypothetical protein